MQLWRFTPIILYTANRTVLRRLLPQRRYEQIASHLPPLNLKPTGLDRSTLKSQDDQKKSTYDNVDKLVGSVIPAAEQVENVSDGKDSDIVDLARLREILSGSSQSPITAIDTIKSLYTSVQQRSQIKLLSASDLSILIFLFGVLSSMQKLDITDNNDLFKYGIFKRFYKQIDHIISGLNDNSYRSHWSFVIFMANNKRELGYQLDENDHYWLMHAALEEAQGNNFLDFSAARRHYNSIVRLSIDTPWIIHIWYIETLGSTINMDAAMETLRCISSLIRRHRFLHPRITIVFWRLLARVACNIPENIKMNILKDLRYRFDRNYSGIFENLKLQWTVGLAEEKRIDGIDNGIISNKFRYGFHDASDYRNVLSDILIGSKVSSPLISLESMNDASDRAILEWGLIEVHNTLSPDFDDAGRMRVAWNSLYFLSLSLNTEVDNQSLKEMPNAEPYTNFISNVDSDWIIICTLATLENLFRNMVEKDGREGRQQLQDVFRTTWNAWHLRRRKGEMKATSIRYTFVNTNIAICFIRLTAITGDLRLKELLTRNICDLVDVCAVPTTISLSPPRNGTNETTFILTVEFATMIALLGARTWDVIFDAICEAGLPTFDDELWKRAVVDCVLMCFIDQYRDGANIVEELRQSASELIYAGSNAKSETDDETIGLDSHQSSQEFLNLEAQETSGTSSYLPSRIRYPFLDNLLTQILGSDKKYYLEPHLAKMMAYILPRTIMDPSDQFIPLLSNIRALEWTLMALVVNNYAAQSAAIVQYILKLDWERKTNRTLRFGDRFLQLFIQRLLFLRRYYSIIDIIDSIPSSDPQHGFIMEKILFLKPSFLTLPLEEKVNRLCFRHDWGSLGPLFEEKDLRMSYHTLTLKAMTIITKERGVSKMDTRMLEDMISVLIHDKHISTALQLLELVADSEVKHIISAKVMNIILTGCLKIRPSNPHERQMAQFAQRLMYLKDIKNIIPDRVTLNLWIKCHLRWYHWYQGNDTRKLRVLFDLLILSGYPGGDITNGQDHSQAQSSLTQVGPFGTTLQDASNSAAMKNLLEYKGPIDFQRHVKPLYLMFIKELFNRGDKEAVYKVIGIYQRARKEYFAI